MPDKKNAQDTKKANNGSDANRFSALASGGHDYSAEMDNDSISMTESEFPSLPTTPSKPPIAKRKMPDGNFSSTRANTPNSEIIATLSALINTRFDALEKLVGENTQKILDLEKKVEACHAELKGVKERVTKLERQIDEVDVPLKLTQRKLDELETYTRRWNLKLFGVPKTSNENVRLESIKICQAVLPEERAKLAEAVDVVHRFGKKRPNDNRPRPIIIRFMSRIHREAVWKAARSSSYLRDHRLQFKEDFSRGDAERRNKLWPAIKKARDAGKIAYFAGGRAFVEGEGEIMLPG